MGRLLNEMQVEAESGESHLPLTDQTEHHFRASRLSMQKSVRSWRISSAIGHVSCGASYDLADT